MLSLKILLSALPSLFIFQTISAHPESTEKDAAAAFDAMKFLSEDLNATLRENIQNLTTDLKNQLEAQNRSTIEAIGAKFDEIVQKRLQILQSLEDAKIDNFCLSQFSEIQNFEKTLSQRTDTCTKLALSTLENIVHETLADIDLVITDLIGCHFRSLQECRYYASENGCYDFVIERIERASSNLKIDFDLLKARFVNRAMSFKLPCQDLIEYEMSVYPGAQFEGYRDCIDNEIQISFPQTCPTIPLEST